MLLAWCSYERARGDQYKRREYERDIHPAVYAHLIWQRAWLMRMGVRLARER